MRFDELKHARIARSGKLAPRLFALAPAAHVPAARS